MHSFWIIRRPAFVQLALCVAAPVLLGVGQAAAQGGCGSLYDPNSKARPYCPPGSSRLGGEVNELPKLATPPFAPPSMGHRLPYPTPQPGRGQFVCAVVDPASGRCLTMRPNTKDYDDAVQTGVEAAMMGMQVQADALRRAQEMGLGGPGAMQQGMPPIGVPQVPTQIPGMSQAPGARAGANGGQTFAECVVAMASQLKAATGRDPSPSQNEQILLQCQ